MRDYLVGHIDWNGFINKFTKDIHIIEIKYISILRPEGGGGGVRASKNRKNYYSLNQFIF